MWAFASILLICDVASDVSHGYELNRVTEYMIARINGFVPRVRMWHHKTKTYVIQNRPFANNELYCSRYYLSHISGF
jgi:hypothetical protein